MLDFKTLLVATQDELNRITSTMPENLTKKDKAFLKAREQYLRPEQLQVYKDVLEEPAPVTKEVKK